MAADLFYSERGAGCSLQLSIHNLDANPTVSVKSVSHLNWSDRPLGESQRLSLKALIEKLPASGAPTSTIIDGLTYRLALTTPDMQFNYEWWGQLSDEWQILNDLAELLRSLTTEI